MDNIIPVRMFTRLLTVLVLVATAEGQSAWEARQQRHAPQGFSLTGGHQHKVHNSHKTAAQSTPPPQQGNNGVQSAVPSNSVAKETVHQHASSNNAATQAQKTEVANNIKPTHSSIPSQHTKHDAGWAAVHKGEVPYYHQPSEGMSKNLQRVLPHNKNSVSIVDHIWKMFQINPSKQTRTQEATNPGNAPAQGFRVHRRVAFQGQKVGNNDHKQTSMFNSNHNKHNNHYSSHKDNHSTINNQNTNHLKSSHQFNNNNNHHQFNNHMNNQHYNHLDQNKNIHNNNNHANNNNNNIYNRQHSNNTAKTGNIQSNVINPIKKVINRVLSPYDKIQTGLESIKSEVGVQQGMLGQLQGSMDKMKEIFFSIQRDMKNVLNAINSIMKT